MSYQRTDYKRLSHNELIRLKRYVNIISNAAKFFERYFVNKAVYYQSEIETVSVYFSATNFMHLCGILYEKGAMSFYNDSLNHNIALQNVKIKHDGTTFQKLQVLNSIDELIGGHVHLTQSGKYLYLEFDYALRTKKQILALTLKHAHSNKIVLQSLLNLKKQTVFPVGHIVHTIYAERLDTKTKEIYFSHQK